MGELKLPDFVQAFLDLATSEIRSEKARCETRAELLSHLEDSVERDSHLGIAREESLKKTIATFGDPKILARGFKRAHRPWYLRWTVMVPSLVLSVLVCMAIGSTIYASISFARQSVKWRERQQLRNEILQFHRDLKQAEPFFAKTFVSGRNAAAYLNPRLPWLGQPPVPAKIPGLALPDNSRRLKASDFKWMTALHDFDYWELISEKSPAVEFLESGLNFGSIPMPDMGILREWAKLRLEFAYQHGGLREALNDSRKIAELLYSTEVLIGTQSATALFVICNRYYEDGVRHGKLRAQDWAPMHLPDRERLKLMGWSTTHWTDIFSPNDFKNELFALQPVLGGCASLSELGMIASAMRSFEYVNSPLPLEFNLSPHLEDLNKFASSQAPFCRMTALKLGLNNHFKTQKANYTWQNVLLELPYLRQYLIAYWMSHFNVDWLGAYEYHLKEKGA